MGKSHKHRHHYVPRFYLRHFANETNPKTVALWNIPSQLYVRRAGLREQAYQRDFYGKDGRIEDGLAQFESGASAIMRRIIADRRMPKLDLNERLLLYTFLLFQAERTKAAADDLETMIDKMLKTAFREDRRIKDYLPHVRIGIAEPAAYRLAIATKMIPLVLDLKAKLVVNESEHEFITSDNPVVRYNQLMEVRRWPGSGVGWANVGLQVLFPLSPRLMIFLYDRGVYRVGTPVRRTVRTAKTSDINQLNGLQFVRAEQNLYFRDSVSETQIAATHRTWLRFRRARVDVREYTEAHRDTRPTTKRSLIVSSVDDTRIDLKLSFVSFSRAGRKRQVGPTMWNPRNAYVERILERIRPYPVRHGPEVGDDSK